MSQTRSPEPITELDLLAYVDGQLDRDPHRRALVERHLAVRPDDAERVADFSAQNEALRRAGAAVLEEPVPERLLAAVRRDASAPHRTLWRAAAVAALVVASAVGGWLVGTKDLHAPGERDAFAAEALLDSRRPEETAQTAIEPALPGRPPLAAMPAGTGGRLPSGPAPDGLAAGELTRLGAAPLAWLRQRIAVEIQAPDLSAEGYRLRDSRRIVLNGEPTLKMVYRRRDGRQASLYLRTRWLEDGEPVRRLEQGDTTLLHWFEGPLAIALVAEGVAGPEVEAMAHRVRDAVAGSAVLEPSAEPLPREARGGPPATQEVRQLDEGPAPADPQL